MSKPITIIDIMPIFTVGDPPPSGYCEWHEWAQVQLKGGLRQKRCRFCGLLHFPQEGCRSAAFRKV